MSSQAMGDAFARSPYKGDIFVVHLAIADVVNDLHGNRLWMTRPVLAEKARTSRATVDRALTRMTEDGWLEVIEAGGGRGKPTSYQYLFTGKPRQIETVSRETASSVNETASSGPITPTPIPREPNIEAVASPRAWKKEERDGVWNALARVWGEPETAEERQSRGAAVKKLLSNGISDPSEIERRGRKARARWSEATPHILASRWSDLGRETPRHDPHGMNAHLNDA